MAHRRGSFRRGISQSQRRKKAWSALAGPAIGQDLSGQGSFTNTFNYQIAAGSTDAFGLGDDALAFTVDAGTGASDIPQESTILRIRGSLILNKNVTDVGNTPPIADQGIDTFAFGIGVMETGATQLGAFPNPATPDGSDWDGWMFYRSINSSIVDANASVIDVKAMRKVESGMTLIMVAGVQSSMYDNTVGTLAALSAALTARLLLLLP